MWSEVEGIPPAYLAARNFLDPKRTNERSQGHSRYYTFRIAIIFVDKYLGWLSSPAISSGLPLKVNSKVQSKALHCVALFVR